MRKINIDWLPLAHTLIRDRTHNPGMCPDREWNQQPFALQDDAQPTDHTSQAKGVFDSFNL